MGKKSFNTVEGLQREIMKRANKALKNEVKDYVEDKMKSHVEQDVYATYWFNQSPWDDRKRKKEAELLFKDEIPPQFIVGFLVYNKKALEKMISFGIPKEKIIVKPEYYY